MYYETFFELSDQGKLAGILHLPPPSMRPCPIVIYCPGKNGERYEVHRLAVKFARQLAELGIAFLRFDYYGMGLSDGEYHEMTTSTKVSNIKKAFQYIRLQPEILPDEVAYLGFSDGARIALMAALETGVDRIALWSPLFYEFAGNHPNNKPPRFWRHPIYPRMMVMPWAGLWVGMNFYYDLKTINIEQKINAYQGESLIVYGDDDPLIAEEFVHLKTEACHLYRGDDAHQVYKVAGAGHLFTSRALEDRLMGYTADWLCKKFALRTNEG
ncbi:alpha/beta hydrolase [Brevibacillus fulvus]|uniref:Alpha/beta superfamily hydrolase n=1 Tax=Brevibacillus fulvus TaxID=1125967 RepID=A0A938Y093_9BACL|nr:alpha/beta hydrolase [Brevibacillus fulvus]MBM7589671.1 alpha/beta superfamily hydrolase [Brevibacillus fulvus]